MKEYLLIALKGFAMGAANVVPGVSGGTIAVITGIYERLIDALKGFNFTTARLVLRGEFREAIQRIDLPFLVSLAAGVLASLLTLAKVLKWGLEKHESLVMAFFFGLILASIYFVGKMIKKWNGGVIVLFILGASIAAAMALLTPASENANPVYLALCGVVGMCSMIIPGLSGSFVLLLMGNYQLIALDTLNHLRSGNLAEALPVLVPVGIGSLLGIALLAKLLSWLFRRFHDLAMGMVTGFIAGSLVLIWPWKVVDKFVMVGEKKKILSYDYFMPDLTSAASWLVVGCIIAGVVLMVLTEKLAPKKD